MTAIQTFAVFGMITTIAVLLTLFVFELTKPGKGDKGPYAAAHRKVSAWLRLKLIQRKVKRAEKQKANQKSNQAPPSPPSRSSLDRKQTEGVKKWLQEEVAWLNATTEELRYKHEQETPEVFERLFWSVTAVVIVTLFLLEVMVLFLMPSVVPILGVPLNPQWIIHILILVYLVCGFTSVETDKIAGLDFAGTPVRQFGHGLKWFPFLVFNFSKESATLVQAEFPGDANNVHWGDEKTDLPKGKVRPIYILTGENPESILPSDKQINLGTALMVKIQATYKRFFDLVRNTPPIDPENGAEILETIVGNSNVTPRLLEILRHLRDTNARIAAEIIGQLSYNEITTHRALVDEWLQARIQLEVVAWGVEFRESGFTTLNPGHEYNKGIAMRAEAIADRDAAVTRAEGEKKKRILEGEGAAAALRAQFEAEAAGKKAIKKALGVSGEAVLASELGEKVAENGNAVIADGLGGLGAMFAAGTDAMSKAKGTTP